MIGGLGASEAAAPYHHSPDLQVPFPPESTQYFEKVKKQHVLQKTYRYGLLYQLCLAKNAFGSFFFSVLFLNINIFLVELNLFNI